jgi:hypothetical protein
MKNRNYTKIVLVSAFLALLILIGRSDVLLSSSPEKQSRSAGNDQLAQQRHEMMEEMKAQDVLLANQIAAMNNAPADKKLLMMTDIITTIARERSERDARMELMQENVIQYMIAAKDHDGRSEGLPGDKDSK